MGCPSTHSVSQASDSYGGLKVKLPVRIGSSGGRQHLPQFLLNLPRVSEILPARGARVPGYLDKKKQKTILP